jgi:hypothetical protein
MKSSLAILASLAFVIVLGCGTYDSRLEQTLADMRYRKRLDDNLNPAPTKGLLEKQSIYVRPPLNLQGPTKAFVLTVVEPGRFDLENSFVDQQNLESMHILARVKRPKAPNAKKTNQPEAPRGDFNSEVVELLRNVYGANLDVSELKTETKSHGNRTNAFRTKSLDLTAKEVQLYLYGDKNSPYEVALVFEYPKERHNSINPKIGLCLESFAVGEAAKRAFASGGEIEGIDEGIEGGGQTGPPI